MCASPTSVLLNRRGVVARGLVSVYATSGRMRMLTAKLLVSDMSLRTMHRVTDSVAVERHVCDTHSVPSASVNVVDKESYLLRHGSPGPLTCDCATNGVRRVRFL
eukprot:TRINITY_DN3987_c1_g1_i2.p2 TRINITY_DN3987_c1_g1~~TRINITY_DN3987_c1_g1_i2.p2  ORF type:complete len:105 (-),score=4.11 TRINITY_DN3987_c1_g1_i2:14-328(-)